MICNVRDFGATGDGVTLDTEAINAAVQAAANGGTVLLPPGRYLSHSIRLISGVTLHLAADAVLEAAPGKGYNLPEDNPFDLYQDFGHSHWRNSLIWGEGLSDIVIEGDGVIDGMGLTREGPGSQWKKQAGEFPLSMRGLSAEVMAELSPEVSAMQGLGNKAISLKRCRNVVLRGLTIVRGGHFALLATGCDDLVCQDLSIDTNRDGLDIDGCRRVVVRGCRVNTPNDDAIVLKSSFALGERRAVEDVLIEGCVVSGYDPGTMVDGTFGRTQAFSPDRDRVTGRIKIGTESSGDFRRITIRDCRFERSRGLALETVDGGVIEDVTVEDVILQEVTTAPLFLRVGARLRAPEGAAPGVIRRVTVRRFTAQDVLADYCAILMGMPGHPIEDVVLQDVRLSYRGGGVAPKVMPEALADAYPEPSMFGITPAWGLWARHVRGLVLDRLELRTVGDERPERSLDDVTAG
ncbi:glycoside hydrolase family protein [Asticcacaulis biprosthecium C19]|uniref:Glycoside hydrolase family protein n=1 Tax=Asticcacaulis biprosthecium C19 TaxID=715226 RepID=F4QHD4_9CAUL|nr:glycosyl hydrolase family 28-related protein [Asticcacaulis biprosthecium]EGF92671.1 glycoside hydrolase family protein [Asticcacaulis biprosthecium C19]